jgi:hypothetical protein
MIVAAAICRLRLLVDASATTGLLDTALLSLSDWRKRKKDKRKKYKGKRSETRTLGDVAVESIDDDCDVGSHG